MKKLFEILNKAEPATTMTCVVGFTSVLMLRVAVHLANHLLDWCNDVALLILAWTTLLDGDVAFRAERMVNVGILIGKLPVALRKAMALIVYAILLVVMSVMVRQGLQLYTNMGKRTLEGVPFLSYVWIATSISVGFSLMFIAAVKRLYDLTKTTDSTVISEM